jgi:acyl carrier protein
VPEAATTRQTDEEDQAAAAVLLELLMADPEERLRRLEEYLQTATARVLGLEPTRLDPKMPLTSLGMDSIMVVELKNHIEKAMSLKVSIVDLFTGSVAKIAEQLAEKLGDDGQVEQLLAQVERMTPEEIESLLAQEKGQTP